MGTRLGKMNQSDEKLVRDIDKVGLQPCANTSCHNAERQPKQFATCSRCKWAAYCSRTCQETDWTRHKKECKTAATQKRVDYKEQKKDDSSLQYGASQHLLTIVRYLHHYAAVNAVAGNFPVVGHTAKGSILFHDNIPDETVKAYCVVGITQSIQTLLEPMNEPLPIYIRTAISPYKNVIVRQGTITPQFEEPGNFFKGEVVAYTKRQQIENHVLTRLQ